MRSDAKASSAGSNRRRATGLGRILREAFAIRDASCRAEGGGAPSPAPARRGRPRLLLVPLAALVLLLAFGASLAGAKQIAFDIGSSGSSGTQFGELRGIDINQAGNGGVPAGAVYVADRGNNRVSSFDADGNFLRAWGGGVAAGGAAGVGDVLAGSIAIEQVETTAKAFGVGQTIAGAGIPAGAQITGISAANGGTLFIDQPATATGSDVLLTVAADPGNVPLNELQTVTSTATGGTFNLTFSVPNPDLSTETTAANIPFDATAAQVESALETLAGLVAGDVSVSGVAGGPWAVEFTGRFADTEVHELTVATGSPPLSGGSVTVATTRQGGSAFEVCETAATCKAGVGGGAAGQLEIVNGLAVDQATGNVYVLDTGNNRIQAFDADGDFVRMFGGDVVTGGAENADETQVVTVRATAGQFKLSFGADTTADLPFNATAAEVEAALNGLASIEAGGGSVSLSGGPGSETGATPYIVSFDGGPLADANVAQLSAASGTTPLSGGSPSSSATVATQNPGATGFEVCTLAANCRAGIAGSSGGMLVPPNGNPGLEVDSAGDVYVADAGNNRRIQKYDSSGNFLRLAGWDVVSSGPGNDVVAPTNEFEICTHADGDVCKAGTSGSGAGQFTSGNPYGVAASPGGDLYVVTRGTRIQRFDSSLLVDPGFAPTLSGDLFGVTVNPADGHLFVSRFNGSTMIDEVDPATQSLVETTAVGVDRWVDIAVNGSSGRLYASNHGGFVRVSHDAPAPQTLAATAVAATTAVLNGTVNPEGFALTDCRFEYLTEEAFEESGFSDLSSGGTAPCDPAAGAIPADESDHAVEADISGLEPNGIEYRFRLVVEFAGGTQLSPQSLTFTTRGPIVRDTYALSVGYDEAILGAVIDPQNAATVYRFEYGTQGPCSANPCTAIPVPDAPVGSDETDHKVGTVVPGLHPGTAYHFRVVATNADAIDEGPDLELATYVVPVPRTDCPNQAIRQAQGSTHLPDCRAYEMVSPPDKNGGNVDEAAVGDTRPIVSYDGRAVGFCTTALFGEPSGQQAYACAPYLSRRTAAGWQTTYPFPPFCKFDVVSGQEGRIKAYLSPDFSRAAIELPEFPGCPIAPLDPAAPRDLDFYLQDFTTDPAGFQLLMPNLPGGGAVVGGSEDFSHVIFNSKANQTEEPDSPPAGDFKKLYEYHQGSLRLVSVTPGGQPFSTSSEIAMADIETPSPSAVSVDGERVFFQNENAETPPRPCGDDPACQLYLREGGATTLHVSASECSVDCGPIRSPAQFDHATPDGAIAFFLSCDRLTDASAASGASCGQSLVRARRGDAVPAAKLYRWDRSAAPGARLTDLTADQNPADGTSTQPGAVGVVGASSDGGTVFFVAHAQLIAGEPEGPGPKLYRWRLGAALEYLGPFQKLDLLSGVEDHFGGWQRRSSPDGAYLTIHSDLALDPAADGDAASDIYRWGEEEGWSCVSCQPPVVPSTGAVQTAVVPGGQHYHLRRVRSALTISEDGRRVLFASPDRLVPEDTNDNSDTYQWQALGTGDCQASEDPNFIRNGGCLSLISGGVGDDDVALHSSDRHGEGIFFVTRAQLVGHDFDENTDIYTARVNGGFPEPEPEEAGCEGEGCRGQGTDAPEAVGAGTAAFAGPESSTRGGNMRVRCVRASRRAQRFARRAARLRRAASRAARASSPKRATGLRRKARRYARAAQRRRAAAKRCRARTRGANADRRTNR